MRTVGKIDKKSLVDGKYYLGGHKPVPIGTVDRGQTFGARKQSRSKVAQNSQILDESLENFKQPNSDLDVSQKIIQPGETVPIVFGKRSNDIGGVWIKPSLVKAGTSSFVQKLLFVISQGEIASTPEKAKAFTGLKKLTFLDDTSISLSHLYNTAATLASSPTTCPISSSGLFCGNDIYSYLVELKKASSGSSLENTPDLAKDFFSLKEKTFGTGDTSNTTFITSLQVFDAETGANVTTNYQNIYLQASDMEFKNNTRFDSSFNVIGGKTVGTIEDFNVDFNNGNLFAPVTGSSLSNLQQVSGGRTKFIFKHTFVSLDTQTNTSNPASTGTLEGVQTEYAISPTSTLTNNSNNNSSFADITFLASSGNLYETPSSGTFPTTTKQLYIFYDEGVKVDLFSAGLSGSSYTVGASNQFIDLAMYLFKVYKKIDGNNTASIVAPVELSNLQSLSSFCSNNSMFFNGIISKSVNIVDYISSIAPFYFLSFLSVAGKYRFAPTLPINSSNQIDTTALTPVATFNETNILQNTFTKIYFNVEDRRNFIANCIYTECIPTEISRRKTISVKFTNTDLDSPTEQYDLSECCSDVNHAILYAKYELSKRKHSTHNIAFSTSLVTTTLIPTDLIKIEIKRENSVGDNRTEINYYQITSITYNSDGISNIQAIHFPLDSNNKSEISTEITSGTFTVLQ
mgnify:CR=1 FL=1